MATPYLGEIRVFSFGFTPKGWLPCAGQLLAISQNAALFSLLGTMYGGNGQTTFALPDFRGRVPLHAGGNYVQGARAGEETHTLQLSELPAHTHPVIASSNVADQGSPQTNFWTTESSNAYSDTANSGMDPAAIGSTGGSQAHENRSPFLTLNFCIAATGIFPSRN